MPISEFFFGTQLAERAIKKIRGRGKITDTNVKGGKKEKNMGCKDTDTSDE